MAEISGRVSEIHRYPVKSMAGERLDSSLVGTSGIAGDRHYALRDLENDKILSGKHPAIGRILLGFAARTDAAGAVVVSIDGTDYAATDGAAIDAALSAAIGRPVHLETGRAAAETYESYWPEVEGVVLSDISLDLPIGSEAAPGTFVDVAGLHVVATASMAKLRSLIPESAVAVARFRPNLVIDLGSEDGFVENDWVGGTARVGTARIRFDTVTPRCVMTTLAQPNLPADRAILRTLADHNRLDYGGFGMFGCLGVYGEVIEPGEVHTGDEFTLQPAPA